MLISEMENRHIMQIAVIYNEHSCQHCKHNTGYRHNYNVECKNFDLLFLMQHKMFKDFRNFYYLISNEKQFNNSLGLLMMIQDLSKILFKFTYIFISNTLIYHATLTLRPTNN